MVFCQTFIFKCGLNRKLCLNFYNLDTNKFLDNHYMTLNQKLRTSQNILNFPQGEIVSGNVSKSDNTELINRVRGILPM